MRKAALYLAAFAVVAMLASVAEAAKKPAKDAPRRAKKGDDVPAPMPAAEAIPSFTDDMEKLRSSLELTEKQAARLEEMRKLRESALGKLDAANAKRIERAEERVRRIRKASERARAQKMLEQQTRSLLRNRKVLADGHEKRMFAVLTLPQKIKWNGPLLLAEVEREFASVSLTEDQKKEVQKLCDAQAKQVTMPFSPKTHASTVKLVANQVNLRVLTPEQKKAYAQAKRPAPRPKRSGGGIR